MVRDVEEFTMMTKSSLCSLYRSPDTLPEVINKRLLDHVMVYVTLCVLLLDNVM